ncbi:MAG: FtsX-like permease family protein [Desulfobacterales bacterium]
MTLKHIAIRNLLRRKGKAAFVLAGLSIGIATVVAVIGFVEAMTGDINHKLEKYGANILIVPRAETLPLAYGGLALGGVSFEMEEIRETDLARVMSIKNYRNIAALGPLVLGVVNIDTHRVLISGIDFNTARILKPWWVVAGDLPTDDGILAGAEAARVLNLQTGGPVTVKGRQLQVSGVLRPTGSQDDQLLFTTMATAQAVLGKSGRVSMAEVAALCQNCPIDDMVQQISDVLPGAKVMAIQQVVKGRMETLAQFRKFSYGVSGVVILIGALVVLVTMMGSVRERTGEIGIFRAIGFRKSHVMRIVFLEAGIVSLLAGLIGYAAGFAAASAGLRLFIDDRMVHLNVSPGLAAFSFGLALAVGLAASAYPALMAARMDPNDALRAL